MFCNQCGRSLNPDSKFCGGCGAQVTQSSSYVGQQPQTQGSNYNYGQPNYYQKQVSPDDRGGFWWGVLGFITAGVSIIVPIVLWVIWKSEYPKRSKSILIGMFVGLAGLVALIVLIIVAGIAAGLYDFEEVFKQGTGLLTAFRLR